MFRFLTFSTVHEIDYLNELTPDLIRNEFFLIKCHPGKVICTGHEEKSRKSENVCGWITRLFQSPIIGFSPSSPSSAPLSICDNISSAMSVSCVSFWRFILPAFGANVVSLIFGAIIVVLVGCLSMIERHKPALHSVRNDEESPR